MGNVVQAGYKLLRQAAAIYMQAYQVLLVRQSIKNCIAGMKAVIHAAKINVVMQKLL
jgi:hypothetical protein